ncbi:hypothetical protein LTR97_004751 [Elasticomyces elasticus]|uniref:Uncharacterized protein n=1 Tax=Elasticomyces elasticus TaxID=574655 RepID=A0AAN8A2N4_9PEZI|nr:hypothetical protein LTR97_004751 [Elasticomyces elasticus]
MAPKQHDKRDDYWRVDSKLNRMSQSDLRYHLSETNYPSTNGLSKERLLWYARRVQRGQLCYHQCSDSELQKFARDRGLRVPGNQFRKKAYIDALEKADLVETFAKFVNLAPELRTLVYGYYLDEFEEQLDCPTQPPLARSCRLARKESLPLFYDRTRLNIKLDVSWASRCLQFDAQVMSFVLGLSDDTWSMVRKLRFETDLDPEGHDGTLVRTMMQRMTIVIVTYKSKESTWGIQSSLPYAQTVAFRDARSANLYNQVNDALQPTAGNVRRLMGEVVLSAKRVYAVRRGIEKVYFA